LVARHFFDYNRPAGILWAVVVGLGVGALVWALADLWTRQTLGSVEFLLGLALVWLSSRLPLQIPRTLYSMSLADVFVFAMLLALGPAAAILAAGLDGALGAWRASKRLSSRLSTPAAHMAAMALCGWAFALLASLLSPAVPVALAQLLALVGVALVPFAGTTLPLMSVVALKNKRPIQPLAWLRDNSWIAAIYLGAATSAGLLHLIAVQHGPAVYLIAALAAFAVFTLLRSAIDRQERQLQAEETKLAQARTEAEASQRRFTAAFTHAAVGMCIVRPAGPVLQINDAMCEMLGRKPDQVLGHAFEDLLHPGDVPAFENRALALALRPEKAFSIELRCIGADGGDLWVALHCSAFEDPGNEGECLIYQAHDITSRRHAETRLQHIAFHDGLTDLANRHYFQERLGAVVERSRLDENVRFAVVFLDLDRFKIVNDSLGHLAGNLLLQEVASRLRACVRPADLVARLGGDEFALLLPAVADHEDGLRVATRVLEELRRAVAINGTEVVPGASIGITFSDLGYRTGDEILRDADLAMYEAKAAGRGRVVQFDTSMHERIADRLALEADLRHAIGEGQLSLVYQPLFALQGGRVVGFEVLARWMHPERGPISPAVFITLAEEAGHIEALTHWVLEQAVAQLAQWRAVYPEAHGLDMHVNVSSRDLANGELGLQVQRALRQHALPAECLCLEITETTLMGNLSVALKSLHGMRALGVHFSIDDFGTGYSSLSYLGTLPIDSLKIDRSFVMDMERRPQNVEIVRAVLNLGQTLGKTVIAEGIETAAQLAELKRLGVPVGQGYLLSRPLAAADVPALLMVNQRAAAVAA
jgi:diguanylate cyclase (GGDEF)-like protein/PAS domain S-box-containing protein